LKSIALAKLKLRISESCAYIWHGKERSMIIINCHQLWNITNY